MSEANELIQKAEMLFNSAERQNAIGLWQQVAEFIMPEQSGQFTSPEFFSQGEKKTKRYFDSIARQANLDLASSFQSTLTNATTEWSKLSFKSEDLTNDSDASKYIETFSKQLHEELDNSNFYNQLSSAYPQYTGLGNFALHVEEKEDNSSEFSGFNFKAYHLSEIAWEENKYGYVDSVAIKSTMTAKQIIERFPLECISDKIKVDYEKGIQTKYIIYKCIYPNDPKKIKINKLGMAKGNERPFLYAYIESSTGCILEQDGYYDFPVFISRFYKNPGEVYGRGPGHIAYSDVRTLHDIKRLSLEGAQRAIAPNYWVTQINNIGQFNFKPWGVNVVRDINGIKENTFTGNTNLTQFVLEDIRNQIKAIFYLDKLLLPNREKVGEMTAYEISKRVEEMNRVLGPVLSRLQSEFLIPLVTRLMKMMLRKNAVNPIPDILKGRTLDIDIKFLNPLARAQQFEQITSMQQWAEFGMSLARMNPAAIDYINVDEMMKISGRVQGVPELAITNDDDVQKTRDARAKQQQAAQQLDTLNKTADSLSKMSKGGGQPNVPGQ